MRKATLHPLQCRGAVCATVGLLLCAPGALARPTTTWRAPPETLRVNEAFELVLVVRDFDTCTGPRMPALPGCNVRSLGTGGDIFERRNAESPQRMRKYGWELTPRETGPLRIPPLHLTINDTPHETPPLTLEVLPATATTALTVTIVSDRRRVYVGQRVLLTLRVSVRAAEWGSQRLDATTMLRALNPINFGPFAAGRPNRIRSRTGEGVTRYIYEWDTHVVAERPGPLHLEQLEVGLSYPAEHGTRELRAQPEVSDVNVRPVPAAGRPPHYNGVVGLYGIETQAAPRRVRVGDPITLTIAIYGEGPLETSPPPALAAHPDLVANFRFPTEDLAGTYEAGRRLFQVILRATHADVRELPALEYPYFDPDAQRFVIARSAPIPLDVAPAATPTARRPAPRADSRQLDTRPAEVLATAHALDFRILAMTLLAPPLLFAGCWLLVALRRRAAGLDRAAEP